MSSKNTKSDLNLPIQLYKEILRRFDFAQPFLDDPAIFTSDSVSSRNFLIHAFAYINSEFHYLSFLNKDVDQEILKAAEILQILPTCTKKSDKLFDNLNDSEVTKFWNRLFVLLKHKKESDNCFDTLSICQEKKFEFFKDISKMFDYVNYELPMVKEKNLNCETLNKEIEKWNAINMKSPAQSELSSFLNYDGNQTEHINIEKILIDLKQVISMLRNTQFSSGIYKHEHLEFFSSFKLLTENINQYIKNLEEIYSLFLDELHQTMLTEDKLVHSSCLYFLKKCSNYFKTLRDENKFSL